MLKYLRPLALLAIEVILEELKTKTQTLPPPPAWPDKSLKN